MIKILFVCMGNICRSPTAEGVFRKRIAEHGLREGDGGDVYIDSAGTHAYHVGQPPDERAYEAAARRGIDLGGQVARRVELSDFDLFDYILAMDRGNLDILMRECPAGQRAKLDLFLSHAPEGSPREVPDPYYGGDQGFDYVLDLVEAASDGLIMHIKERHFS